MCVAATDLDEKTGSCDDNHLFLEQANACLEKVLSLRAQVTNELKARMGKKSPAGQNQNFDTSKTDQSEAVAAHAFMIKITETALDELDKYFDYVVQPDDAETDDEVLETPCYNDAVVPIDDISEKLEDMLDEMDASKDMEESMGKTSGSRETNVKSLNDKAADSKSQSAPVGAIKKGQSPNTPSTITGVEDRKAKENPSPTK